MKTLQQYINESTRGIQLNTNVKGTLMNLVPAQPRRMKEKITDWLCKAKPHCEDESNATWEDIAIALDFGDLQLFSGMLTDKKTGTPLDIRITEVLTELAKILGAKLDVVQKSWKMLGKVKPSKDEFDDPSEVRRWLKNRAKA